MQGQMDYQALQGSHPRRSPPPLDAPVRPAPGPVWLLLSEGGPRPHSPSLKEPLWARFRPSAFCAERHTGGQWEVGWVRVTAFPSPSPETTARSKHDITPNGRCSAGHAEGAQ